LSLLTVGAALLLLCCVSSAVQIRLPRQWHRDGPDRRFENGFFTWTELELVEKDGPRYFSTFEIPFVVSVWHVRNEWFHMHLTESGIDTNSYYNGWVLGLNVWVFGAVPFLIGGLALLRAWRRDRFRRANNRCQRCGYSL